MSSTEVVDKLQQKRELRRKKILENAKYRLEKLNGSGSGDSSGFDTVVSNDTEYPDPEVEPNVIEYRQTQTYSMAENSSPQTQIAMQCFIEHRLHIVLLSLVIYTFCIGGVYNTNTCIPILGCCFAEVLFFRPDNKDKTMKALFMALVGVKNRKAGRILNVFMIFQSVLFDFSIGVFVYGILTLLVRQINPALVQFIKIS